MKKIPMAFLSLAAVLLMLSPVLAAHHTPEDRGKALFRDAHFAGGTKACNSCHPNGKGLGNAGSKKEFTIMGKTQKSLAEAVNFCIVGASKGKAIDPKSEQMKDMVAYIKSLKPAAK